MTEGPPPELSRALAFYRARPDAEFWSRQWSGEDLDRLLAVARVSQLTRFIEKHLHAGDRVLEAGCGLGQYVQYFAKRGVSIVGVDFSDNAITAHLERFPDSDLQVADLAALPFASESFDAILSLGVIEHYPNGGVDILRESRRVLRDEGILCISTPYLNLSRRVLRRWISRNQDIARRSGADFYQYAFSERELDILLEQNGFYVAERSYYDPGRGLRDLCRLLSGSVSSRASARVDSTQLPREHHGLKLRLLYAIPTLKLLAHMQIVIARKSPG
jgi:SAM-dependent methyltransferase